MTKASTTKHALMTEGQIEAAAQLFTALSEPARLKMIQALMDSDLTVTELIELTGFKQANVSKHLALLLRAGLVKRSKEGTFARYSLTEPFLKELCALVCGNIERQVLNRLHALKG